MPKKIKAAKRGYEQILVYERDAPKFDVYTVEFWDKEWKRRIYRRCFASFGDAYLWGLELIALDKDSFEFCIIGETFKRRVYDKNVKGWYYEPFNRLDCEEVSWYFDKSGELQNRQYDYAGILFEYMPSDAEEDAGTHFQKGDLVKIHDTIYVISLVPGRKKDNRWENYYTVLKIIKKDDGSIYASYTSHEHFHESKLTKFTEPIDKFEVTSS